MTAMEIPMPLYEFECAACQEIFEQNMRMSDPQPDACALCGKGPIKKLVSRSAFKLAGGGWYSEGYDGASNRKGTKTETTTTPAAATPAAAPKS